MTDVREQRMAVKFCFLLGKTLTETHLMFQTAYKNEAMSKARVYDRFLRFKNGKISVEDKPGSGRPSISRTDENVDKINTLLREDRRRTIDKLLDMTRVSFQQILSRICCIFGAHGTSSTMTIHLLTPSYLLNSI